MKSRDIILSVILVIFYSVGIVGTHIPNYKDSFFHLSYFNLILSFIILIIARNDKSIAFWRFIGFAFLIGMAVEWIGVHTGLLFGDYYYGKNLGYKFFGVPLVIGINWAMLTVVSASIINKINTKVIVKILLGALVMTFFDMIMEPVAIKSDFWHWKDEIIPLFNYVCWFLISLVLQIIYFRFNLVESNKVHNLLLLCMTLFFVGLILF